jgi:D-3-phosphoglycerate dehydrogenase
MLESARLINTCRGEVVAQDALLKALQENWISGAALDVTYPKPLPNDHPFYGMDYVILTPHVSFYSDASILLLKERITTYVVSALTGQGEFPAPEL